MTIENSSEGDPHPPTVFLSYSHDSPEHKRWVASLASRLVDTGIQVILDQWDLEPGDDVPKFMEKGLSRADRVLMICTEPYVEKANEGKGGVGYEAMIVTAELVKDLGTNRFIPIVRQSEEPPALPTSVSSRKYVNLSKGKENADEEFKELVRVLHQAPPAAKPPLGRNPFDRSASRQPVSTSIKEAIEHVGIGGPEPPRGHEYLAALELVRGGGIVAWRRLIRQAKSSFQQAASEWKDLNWGNVPDKENELPPLVLGLLRPAERLMLVALAGVESEDDRFRHQVGLLEDLLQPRGWAQSGSSLMIYLPEALGFVYQALYGSMCLTTDQPTAAAKLATTSVQAPSESKRKPLYKCSQLVGWPFGLNRNHSLAWRFLVDLPENLAWLEEAFGDADQYTVALIAYYMTLSVVEVVDVAANATGSPNEVWKNLRLEIPQCYLATSEQQREAAYRLLLNGGEQTASLWRERGVDDRRMQEHMAQWSNVAGRWYSQAYPTGWLRRIPQVNLVSDIV